MNFSTRSQADLNFRFAKRHNLFQPKEIHECQLCHQFFAGFYPLPLQGRKVHFAQNVSETENVTLLAGQIDDGSLTVELETCKHFLEDSKTQGGKHRLLNFVREKLDTHTLSQKLNTDFEKLKFAGKLNVAFGFVLNNVEYGSLR